MRKPEPQDQRTGPGAPVPAAISGPQPVPPNQQQMGGPPQLPGGAPQLPAGPGGHGHGPQGPHGAGPMGQNPMGQNGPMGGPMGQNPMGQGGPMGGPMGQGGPGPMGQGGPGPMGQGGPMGGPGPQLPQPGQGPGGDSAARVLSLAQQTADQAIAEARSEANKIVGEAAAVPRAWSGTPAPRPTRWSGTRRRSTAWRWARWESARATLERKVEDLRGFEREYRTRLKSYLESQLRQLENQADDSLAPPRASGAPSLPPAPR
ncbi:hypothetical protein GCM10020221_01900 [Streptomyces thioluteus]|uniref:Uncharacterized protein n=1 Tax=Streptomyces thioluteus TaxID=66431 RepID=A0ABN3WBL7_STRTU